jgi:hypothetical protein
MEKRRFLYCYHRARIEAITEGNICSGWRETGLWPVSRVRALGSRHIFENHQIQPESSNSGGRNSFIGPNGTPEYFPQALGQILATPTRSWSNEQNDREVRDLTAYLCEITLYHRDFVSTKPSIMARASHTLARAILNRPEVNDRGTSPA